MLITNNGITITIHIISLVDVPQKVIIKLIAKRLRHNPLTYFVWLCLSLFIFIDCFSLLSNDR